MRRIASIISIITLTLALAACGEEAWEQQCTKASDRAAACGFGCGTPSTISSLTCCDGLEAAHEEYWQRCGEQASACIVAAACSEVAEVFRDQKWINSSLGTCLLSCQ